MKNITKLNPVVSTETTISRLAAYTRVSSDSADQLHSFAAQIRYYTDYAVKHSEYELVDIYADEAVTGTCMDKRDDFNRLIRDCKKGKIDRIIVKSVSRFARNTKELLTVIRMLKGIGVSVYFEEQGIDTAKLNTEMILTFPGMAAQKESETISDNMRWSYKKRMESGDFNCCRAAYGYTLINGQLEIIETEAMVVRRVFNLYLSGMGKQTIANLFNDESIPKRYGNDKWHTFSVDYILNNERYMGDALLQKSYTTEVLPYRKVLNNGEKKRYYVENSNPPIVSREIFQAAQELQKLRKTNGFHRPSHTLTAILKCPDCGKNYRRQTVNGIVYWLCSYKASGRSKCQCQRIREDEVCAMFTSMISKLTTNRKYILDNLIASLQKIQEQSSEEQFQLQAINKQLADFGAKNHVLAQFRSKGILNDVEYTSQSRELNRQISELRLKRKRLLAENEDDEQLEMLKTLNEILTDYKMSETFDEELFGQIVDSITIISQTELKFTLTGGLKLTEIKIEKARCDS